MSGAGRYIVIPNWGSFQHYKDRTPLWIKNYTELMSDDAYLKLTLRQRGILHGIWLLMARGRLVLGSSPASLGSMLGDPTVRTRDLEALNHAGFIEFSTDKPLASRYQNASLEVEVDIETPLPPSRKRTEKARKATEAFVRNAGRLMPESELLLELRDRRGCDELETRRLLELARQLTESKAAAP